MLSNQSNTLEQNVSWLPRFASVFVQEISARVVNRFEFPNQFRHISARWDLVVSVKLRRNSAKDRNVKPIPEEEMVKLLTPEEGVVSWWFPVKYVPSEEVIVSIQRNWTRNIRVHLPTVPEFASKISFDTRASCGATLFETTHPTWSNIVTECCDSRSWSSGKRLRRRLSAKLIRNSKHLSQPSRNPLWEKEEEAPAGSVKASSAVADLFAKRMIRSLFHAVQVAKRVKGERMERNSDRHKPFHRKLTKQGGGRSCRKCESE